MVLPFTVCASLLFLNSRPSLRILLACIIVTLGFFVGVFLDGTHVSLVGIGFGVASSAITATHSIVIKKSLAVVNGSALLLSWYTNLLSVFVLAPIVVIAGEGPQVLDMLLGADELLKPAGATSTLKTFVWGSLITVNNVSNTYPHIIHKNTGKPGHIRLSNVHCCTAFHQSDFPHYAYGFLGSARSCSLNSRRLAFP